jgi:AcrR family transcriptional regulator
VKAKDSNIRERVIHCAGEYILQRGIRGWNMDQLAAAAGITKRTLYKIIVSKEELIEKVVLGFIRSVQERIGEIVEAEGDFYNAMEKLVSEFPLLVNSMNSRSMQEIFLEYPLIEKRVFEQRDELTVEVQAFFQRGIRSGFIRGDLEPAFILQLFQAVVMYFIRFDDRGNKHSEKFRMAFDCLINGIRGDR